MPGMFDDLIPVASPAGATPGAASSPAGMFDDLIPAAPPGIVNKPTAKDDPVYHGAVPVAQAPDQGAATAFASGVSGAPIIGPSILGGLQHAAAVMRSLSGGSSYEAELEHVRDMTAISRKQHPTAAFAGDLTGATAALAPASEFAPAAFGAGGLSATGTAAGAVTGAAIGGVDGAVRDGMGGAVSGALGGALGGAAAPVLGAGVSRVSQIGIDAAARALALRNMGVSPAAADILTRAAESDGVLGGTGAANIAAAGPQGMLADAGPGLSTVLDTALQRGGPGSVAARDAIEQRAGAADQQLSGALDTALGQAQGVHTATTDLRTSTAPLRQMAYDYAYAQPIDYTSAEGRSLEDMIANRVPPGIVARANAQMRMDGTPSQQMLMQQQPDGSYAFTQMPDVRQIDYITRSLNDVARAGDGQGALGGNTAEGRSYGNLSRELRDSLRQAVPAYDAALETAAQPIQARNALDFGSGLLSPSVARDEAAATVQGMTGPEMTAARQGVRSQIAETMANVGRTISDPNVDARQAMATVKALSSDAAMQKLGLLLQPTEMAGLQSSIAGATRALELRSSVATNSRTFARAVTNEGVENAAQPGLASRMLMAGGPIKATRPVAEVLTGNRPADIAARQGSVYSELAGALTGPRGLDAIDFMNRLSQANATRAAASSIAGSIPYDQLASTGLLALVPPSQSRP